MLIALHLGAHKTATTYIQNTLELSRQKLNEIGVGYVPLTDVRSTLTGRLGFGRSGLHAAASQLLTDYRSCERLIISDENIIGGLKPSPGRGFYLRRRGRLAKLLSSLGQHNFKIYFATRAYDEFISAIYCEYVRHHPFIDTRSYLRGVDYKAFTWLEIVGTFVKLVGSENVTIWRYEDFRTVQNQVFAALLDAPPNLLEKPTGRIRESLSTRAVQSLACLEPTRDSDELRARSRSAAAAYPKSPGNPPFSAFDPITAEALRIRYERDLARMRHDFPSVHYLRPDGDPAGATGQ
jgi:hypothetical protein